MNLRHVTRKLTWLSIIFFACCLAARAQVANRKVIPSVYVKPDVQTGTVLPYRCVY